MEIKELKKTTSKTQNKKMVNAFNQFEKLLNTLKKKDLNNDIIISINNTIDDINTISNSEKTLKKQIRRGQASVIKLLEKELKLVTKNHYRNSWLAKGMTAFGIPLGVAFGTSLGNMALLGLGIAIGTGMDKKALEEGRQLDIELKHS